MGEHRRCGGLLPFDVQVDEADQLAATTPQVGDGPFGLETKLGPPRPRNTLMAHLQSTGE
ncbi:hypothetical protein R3Q02_27095 [Rhodococcus aetherivorans]|nr:hypothetical protein [Rhodococcus aetherivorans]